MAGYDAGTQTYFWMYEAGLKGLSEAEVLSTLNALGKSPRPKDWENYWNGRQNKQLRSSSILQFNSPVGGPDAFLDMKWDQYPVHPMLGQPDISKRWVPCNAANKPIIKWGEGCESRIDAEAHRATKYLAENMKGRQFIVIDCDGDHGDQIDVDTIRFLKQFQRITHTLSRPRTLAQDYPPGMYPEDLARVSPSFHLTFQVDRVIPTYHMNYCHMDIIGNKENSLRYLKDKVCNGLPPARMTPEIWDRIRSWARSRKEQHG